MTNTAKGIPELSTSAFIKNGPTDINAALVAIDDLLDFRGKSIIATSESRTNANYGLMTTPDRVQNVVLPTDGLLEIGYMALWKGNLNNIRAAIFIGSNQLVIGKDNGAPVTEAAISVNSSFFARLTSSPIGLISNGGDAGVDASDVTTGQVIGLNPLISTSLCAEINGSVVNLPASMPFGGAVQVAAAAGTYDVSVQFKADSSTVTVKSRHLWVRAIPFG